MESQDRGSLTSLSIAAGLVLSFASIALAPAPALAQTLPDLSGNAPTTITVKVVLDYKGKTMWSGDVSLDQGSTASIVDDKGASHDIASDSALEAIAQADSGTDAFSISDLAYFAEWSALYVNCIDITTGSIHACADWMYSVDGNEPPMGADQYTLSDGDTVDFYFDTPAPAATTDASAATSASSNANDAAASSRGGFTAGQSSHGGGSVGGGGGGGWFGGAVSTTPLIPLDSIASSSAPAASTYESPASSTHESATPTVELGMSVQDFIERYLAALKSII